MTNEGSPDNPETRTLTPEEAAAFMKLITKIAPKLKEEADRLVAIRKVTKERAFDIIDTRFRDPNNPPIFPANIKGSIAINQQRALVDALTPSNDGTLELESYTLYFNKKFWNRVSRDP
ncbi:hypothetical protein ACFLZH_05820, partial [Patescibacteria group bacterium]